MQLQTSILEWNYDQFFPKWTDRKRRTMFNHSIGVRIIHQVELHVYGPSNAGYLQFMRLWCVGMETYRNFVYKHMHSAVVDCMHSA